MSEFCNECPIKSNVSTSKGERWTAIHGDAMLALRYVPSESIDIIVTDPPYGTGANTSAARLAASSVKYSSSNNTFPEIAGESVLPDAWQYMMQVVASECLRVATPGADALIFCDWRGYPALLRIMSLGGWSPRGLLVWDKGRGSRPVKNGFRQQAEFILHLRKGSKRIEGEPFYLDGVFRYTTPVRVHHLTEKPVELVKELLRIAPKGSHVLDPFHGSGTTGVAALGLGMMYTGIEKVEGYHHIAAMRLKAAEAKLSESSASLFIQDTH